VWASTPADRELFRKCENDARKREDDQSTDPRCNRDWGQGGGRANGIDLRCLRGRRDVAPWHRCASKVSSMLGIICGILIGQRGEARRLGDERCWSQRMVTYPCLSLKELTKKFRLSSRTVSDVQSRGTEEPAWGNKWILLRRDRMGMMLAMRSPLRMVRVSLKSRWLGAGVGGKGENHSTYARCCAGRCWGKWNLIADSGSVKTTRTWTTR
jgi:hypothetical protein